MQGRLITVRQYCRLDFRRSLGSGLRSFPKGDPREAARLTFPNQRLVLEPLVARGARGGPEYKFIWRAQTPQKTLTEIIPRTKKSWWKGGKEESKKRCEKILYREVRNLNGPIEATEADTQTEQLGPPSTLSGQPAPFPSWVQPL